MTGWQKPGLLNGAVFWVPPESPLIGALFDWLGQEHIVPPWLSWRKRLPYALRPLLGLRPLKLEEHRWGVAGPRAITLCAERLGMLDLAQPPDVFYPLQPKQARRAFDPADDVMALTTERTVAVHLWHEQVKALKAAPPPPGSFAASICAAHGVVPEPA